jgi:hypothetical protein
MLLPAGRFDHPVSKPLASRALRLNCLTTHYGDLWDRNWTLATHWSLEDPRLSNWPRKNAKWSRSVALRNAFERRWALVEIDALTALEFKLTTDELCTIYRTQFPVLRQFERDTWYDRNGRVAFTSNASLGIGIKRDAFDLWRACLAKKEPLPDDIDTQNLEPFDDPDHPFDVRDREADMRHAYAFFVKELGLKEPT